LTAEAAVERVQSDTRARMLRQTDPFLRERCTISTISPIA
jgi:phosphotransferase system enzyme I (PtsP)